MDKEQVIKETNFILDKFNKADEEDRAEVKAGVKLLACVLTDLNEHGLIEAVYARIFLGMSKWILQCCLSRA
ncbi:MAG: hypothetical protein GX663_03015 [Clostridiales bacterium]|nr:hypothetical protein [Clostridiales bacterium]